LHLAQHALDVVRLDSNMVDAPPSWGFRWLVVEMKASIPYTDEDVPRARQFHVEDDVATEELPVEVNTPGDV
jgi:hypothetical protein